MYFTVEKQTGKITGLHSHLSETTPSNETWVEATDLNVQKFTQGMTWMNLKEGTLGYPPINDLTILRTQMLHAGNVILNAWAREKYYTNLSDLLSYKDSTDPEMSADALKAIAARDKMRLDILEYTANLPTEFSITLEAAMASITKPNW